MDPFNAAAKEDLDKLHGQSNEITVAVKSAVGVAKDAVVVAKKCQETAERAVVVGGKAAEAQKVYYNNMKDQHQKAYEVKRACLVADHEVEK